jgi:hypothetical protein
MQMKKQSMILMISVLALSAAGQDSNVVNEVSQSLNNDSAGQQTNRVKARRKNKDYPDQQKKYAKQQQRRIQLMERELKRIGVTEEEKAQITELQKAYKEKMEANAQRIARAREKLSKLQDEGASMEELEAAIQDVSAAQTEQLRILVINRMEMERILGKEKLAQFMQNARTQFQKHGRRGGPPLPPRPGLPPVPGQGHRDGGPPVPQAPPQTPPPPEN